MKKAIFRISPDNNDEITYCAFADSSMSKETFISLICDEYYLIPNDFLKSQLLTNPVTSSLFSWEDYKKIYRDYFFVTGEKRNEKEITKGLYLSLSNFHSNYTGEKIPPVEIHSITVDFPSEKISIRKRLEILFTGRVNTMVVLDHRELFNSLKIKLFYE